jgi:Na+/phosphate symporter
MNIYINIYYNIYIIITVIAIMNNNTNVYNETQRMPTLYKQDIDDTKIENLNETRYKCNLDYNIKLDNISNIVGNINENVVVLTDNVVVYENKNEKIMECLFNLISKVNDLDIKLNNLIVSYDSTKELINDINIKFSQYDIDDESV